MADLSPDTKRDLQDALSRARDLDEVSAMLGYMGTVVGVPVVELNEAYAVQWWSRVVLARREVTA